LGRLAALKVLSAIMKDVAAPASPVSNTGMAPLDDRYDHDGWRPPLTATGRSHRRGSDHDNGDRAAAGEVRSALKRKTRGPRRAEFLIFEFMTL
jgi:hypothetical protein